MVISIFMFKMAHTNGETLDLPAAIGMVCIMIGEKEAEISNIPDNLNEQLLENLKGKDFAIEVDEATDIHRDAQLIIYVSFVNVTILREEFIFCEPFLTNSKAEQIFKITDPIV